MAKIHDFNKKNAEASTNEVHNYVKRQFHEFFTGGGFEIVNIEIVPPERSDAQLLGIDYKITLATVIPGKTQTIYVDHKLRWYDSSPPDGYQFDDVLVEYISNDTTKTLGWAEKQLCTDYVLYTFWPKKKSFWFDYRALKRAWFANKQRWLETYGTRKAPNRGYMTLNCPVPIGILYGNMNLENEITLADEKEAASEFFGMFKHAIHG